MDEKRIQELVDLYFAGEIGWHDIQDIVEAQVILNDDNGCTFDDNIIMSRLSDTDEILTEIENRIKKGGK